MYTFKLLNNSEILCRLLYNTRVWIKEFNLKQKMSLHSAVLYKEKPKDVKAEDTESVTASSSWNQEGPRVRIQKYHRVESLPD